jgi:hypothetical protein
MWHSRPSRAWLTVAIGSVSGELAALSDPRWTSEPFRHERSNSQAKATTDHVIGWVFLIALLGPFVASAIFIVLKLLGVISWGWFAVFSPVLPFVALYFYAVARGLLDEKLNLDGLSPKEAAAKEEQAYLEALRKSTVGWGVVTAIFMGYWHWIFGESTEPSPLLIHIAPMPRPAKASRSHEMPAMPVCR